MMRTALIGLSLTLATSHVATAQDIVVRTAEHDGFTRVALDFLEPGGWQVEQKGDLVRILTDETVAYDLRDVYRRIGSQRVRALRQEGPRELVLEMACDCVPDFFAYGDGLVIDIAPGESDPQILRPVDSRPVANVLGAGLLLPGLLTRGTPEEPSPATSPPSSDRAEALREKLTEDLARMSGKEIAAPRPAEIPVDAPPAPRIAAPRGVQIQTESQVARDLRGYERVPAQVVCPDFSHETLNEWAGMRRSLTPDAGDPAWIAAEAKRLIASGFGIEAERLLAVSGAEDGETELLGQIARLMDGPVAAPDIVAAAECSDMFALFALIADPATLPQRTEAILAALATTPDLSRASLERRAVAGLVALGRTEDARLVERAGTRSETPEPPPDLTSLSLAAGSAPIAARDLEEIVARRTPEAAEAIRTIIDGTVDEGALVAPDLLDQARALLPETTGLDRTRLERALIRAEIAAARYLRAAEGIDALARRDVDIARRLDVVLFETILAIEDDGLFLAQMARLADRPVPDPALRLSLASRVAGNYVPDLALRILSYGTDVPSIKERLLRASLALDTGDAEAAETLILGIEEPEAEDLRIRIAALRAARAPEAEIVEIAPPPPGLRARGTELVDRSAALRAELEQFLGN